MPCCKYLFALFLLFIIASLNATTRIVDINGSGQYTSIQTAITACSVGDTVLVYPGRYSERVFIQTNGIRLISLEALSEDYSYVESTILDGLGINAGISVLSGTTDVYIRGFTITHIKGQGIALLEGTDSSVINCNISHNISGNGAGMYIAEGTAYLSGVKIYDNYALNQGGGMYIYGYMGAVNVTFDPVNRCSIYNNRAGVGQDIVAHSINSDLNIPLEMFTVANPSSYYAAPLRALGNEFQLHIDANTAYHQEINSDLYVSPDGDDANDGLSPSSALKTIHTAVYKIASDSLNQKTVHLLPGTYSRTANQQMFPIALKSWVKVKGAGIEETMIIGEPDPLITNQPLKVFASLDQRHIGMEGMSITTQNTDNSCALWGFREDHVMLKNVRMHELSPKNCAVIDISYVTNCDWDGLIIEDFTTSRMGFLYTDGYLTGIIRNSIFRNASSTYMSSQVWAYPLVWISVETHLLIENTSFSNLTMMDDDSQAISIGGVSNPQYQQYYTFRNCLFSNISCNERGVLIVGHAYPEMYFYNCTFAGHTGNGEALMVNGNVTISNSIFYNERSVEIAINPMDGTGIPTTLTLHNNLIRNGYSDIWQGIGSTVNYSTTNTTGNPLFLGGDDIHNPLYYSLSSASPCIDAGTPDISGLSLLPYDLAGNMRVWNSVIDMGCYEYGAPPVANDDPVAPDVSAVSIIAYPNPFTGFTNIKVSALSLGYRAKDPVSDAGIAIYNIKGQKVKSVVLDTGKVGEQSIYWDGRDMQNNRCASGVYIVTLILDGRSISSRKVTFIR